MATTKKFDFKKSFEELEKIVESFESDSLDLDEGLKKFEKGLELAKQCRSRLEEVENKVIELKKNYGQE